jgi:alkylation response protein AidB-like acyl-CoA dehydrogenase
MSSRARDPVLADLDPEAATDALIERVRAVSPLVRARAHEAERLRRVTDDVTAALAATGVWKALTPRRWGGLGLGLRALCEVARTVSQADTSTGWITCFLMEHNWMICRMPLPAQARLYDGRDGYVLAAAPLAPGGQATRVPGGFVASGKWRYGSGIAHADWTFACCNVETDGENVPWMFLVPVSSVTVHDDWHVAGMCATNSTNVSARELFVPEDMALELDRFYSADRHAGADHAERIYRYPLLQGLLVMMAGVAVGSAEGALDVAKDRLTESAPWGVRRIERTTSRARWAQASQDVRCARLLYQDTLARTIRKGDAREEWSLEEQGQLDLDLATTTHLCKNAIASLLDGCGSSAYQLGDPLQRFWRDTSMLASHLGNDWDVVTERGARFVLGLGRVPTDPLPPRRNAAR